MLYVIENNGVYGLTKGQFSASADVGSKSKRGEPNQQPPIDPVFLALSLGATFVARSFSGDKAQLVPILKAAIAHRGFALVDVISPCVTFNDHEASTKSYRYTRAQNRPVLEADFVPLRAAIRTDYEEGGVREVAMHDGSVVRFRKVPDDFDPSRRDRVYRYLRERQDAGEVPRACCSWTRPRRHARRPRAPWTSAARGPPVRQPPRRAPGRSARGAGRS
jgi:2-oxoglutarate/2-oxoacid ferredoxin oxidoreductase subunit beta